ncbi:MAG: tRNA pseudouridine(13) synthase TruD [Nanoarchaeota archaeon]|nr:tRNA pseudouridine(13) synthase TruD [Nanoarchaeota archaeon]
MYVIKQVPEDFIVKEVNDIELKENGNYSYFILKKKNYTTEKAVSTITHYLKIDRRKIGYAGSKDKNAITEQMISIQWFNKTKDIELKDIELIYKGMGNERLSLGDLKENKFTITVRNLNKEEIKINSDVLSVPNYFDEQRFSKNNYLIGKSILKKDFKKAVGLILEDSSEKTSCFEEDVKEHISKSPNDFVGAIKKVPKKIRMMYVHAFQSLIFNKTVSELIMSETEDYKEVNYSQGIFVFPNKDLNNIKIPIVGFGTEFKDNKLKEISLKLLKEEGITLRDFIVRGMPELASEGDERNMFVKAEKLNIKTEDDELNKNKKKCIISFTLPKGSYATIIIKKIFSYTPKTK